VYWILHEQDVALLQPLSTLFFALLIDQLSRGRGEVPVTLFFDEFANIGPVPDFPTTISVARGRGLSLVLGVQSLSQLDGIYGRDGAETILTNCATKVVLHGLSHRSAEEVSRALGAYTLEYETRSRRPWRGDASIPLPIEETSWSEQRLARPLLTADEVRRLARDEAIVVVSNQRPIWTKRWWWSQEPREARSYPLGQAKAAAMLPPSPAPASPNSPPAAPTSPPKLTLRDLKAKLERLDDDLKIENPPDDVGRDRRR
jgi:type IV secretory pathway TraG/TraD family ATPase VirD4